MNLEGKIESCMNQASCHGQPQERGEASPCMDSSPKEPPCHHQPKRQEDQDAPHPAKRYQQLQPVIMRLRRPKLIRGGTIEFRHILVSPGAGSKHRIIRRYSAHNFIQLFSPFVTLLDLPEPRLECLPSEPRSKPQRAAKKQQHRAKRNPIPVRTGFAVSCDYKMGREEKERR